ncbi:MAG: hypothetical protein JWP27_136, partial [Flaviaesturariibacter sp.]|nr:hypothetical protein [Flaviaesturariibacter sp.]
IWITINAESKDAVREILAQSPFAPYWTLEVNEVVIWDGQNYRLPVLQLN